MPFKPGHMASLLAGVGLLAPGLVFGIWSFGGAPGGVDLMSGAGTTLSLLLLLITPVIILGSALIGRIVLSYLDKDEASPVQDGPAAPPGVPGDPPHGQLQDQRATLAKLMAAARNRPI
jgi:hypothetical protein